MSGFVAALSMWRQFHVNKQSKPWSEAIAVSIVDLPTLQI
jgi:hypothetical protein